MDKIFLSEVERIEKIDLEGINCTLGKAEREVEEGDSTVALR